MDINNNLKAFLMPERPESHVDFVLLYFPDDRQASLRIKTL